MRGEAQKMRKRTGTDLVELVESGAKQKMIGIGVDC